MNSQSYFAVSSPSAVEHTLKELQNLGALNARAEHSGVSFEGDLALLYKANLWLRTASRVLVPMRPAFSAGSIVMLYDQVRRMRWEDHLDLSMTFAIDVVLTKEPYKIAKSGFVRKPAFTHSQFAAQKIKDAICDRLREKWGARPNVDTQNPDVRVHALFRDGKCILSLDSSGSSLHERGYRQHTLDAPLKETLAAQILAETGWDGTQPLRDPMCGTGTLPIEAALLATNTAPGLIRKRYGFQKWKTFDSALWESLVLEAVQARKTPTARIFASDVSPRAVEVARANARAAGVQNLIQFSTGDFFKTPETFPEGSLIVMNPPYGERLKLGTTDQAFAKALGDRLKHGAQGSTAWIFTGALESAKFIGLKPSKKRPYFNGPIECRLLKFELFAWNHENPRRRPSAPEHVASV